MAGSGLEFFSLSSVEVIQGGVDGLAGYLEAVAWAPPAAGAFVVVSGSPGEQGARYHLFTTDDFLRLVQQAAAIAPSDRTPSAIQDLFGLREGGAAVVTGTNQEPSVPAVVVDVAGIAGVWIEPTEVVTEGPPPSYSDLDFSIPGGGYESLPGSGDEANRGGGGGGGAPPPQDVPPGAEGGYEGAGARRARPSPPAAANGGSPGGEPAPAPGPPKQVVNRNPHLDLSAESPSPGSQFTVTVYADTGAARPGEESAGISLEADPDIRQFPLRVWLTTTPELEVQEPNDLELIIDRDADRSSDAAFDVRVKAEAAPGAVASVTALFVFRGRPCGFVMRNLTIGGAVQPAQPVAPVQAVALADVGTAAEPDREPVIRIDAHAARPDLTVEVTAADTDGERFMCRVTTSLLPGGEAASQEVWPIRGGSKKVVLQYMSEFTRRGISNRQRRDALVGAGILLFNAAPANFTKTFWELIDAGKRPESIYVVSDEPYVPWELMVPNREGPTGEYEQRQPLGVEHAVGRWVSDTHVSPIQGLTLGEAWVIAPQYQGREALGNSAAEARLLNQLFGAEMVTPARYINVDDAFRSPGVTLLHFICHGTSDDSGVQMIKLDPDDTLTSLSLRGMTGARAFRKSQPMVFLNACEIGRPEPALVGVEGFAKSFISLGARCVVAPLWSVKDSVAHEVATTFYRRMRDNPGLPLASILRDIRKKSYDEEGGEDTYAAYTFYGDPLAALSPA